MKTTILVVIGVSIFNLMWALYTTFSKEKIMIKQGEGPLATSTYSFIALRHVVRMIAYYYGLSSIPVKFLSAQSNLKIIILVILLALTVELVSLVVETLVRFVAFKVTYSKK